MITKTSGLLIRAFDCFDNADEVFAADCEDDDDVETALKVLIEARMDSWANEDCNANVFTYSIFVSFKAVLIRSRPVYERKNFRSQSALKNNWEQGGGNSFFFFAAVNTFYDRVVWRV